MPVSLAPLLSRVSDLVPARRRGRRRLQSRRRKSTRPESAMSRCARVHAHARAPIEPHTYPRTHSRLGTLPATPPIPPRLRHTCAPTRVRAHTHTHRQGPRLRYSLSRERRLFRRAPTVAAPHSPTPPPRTPSLSCTRTLHVKHPRTRTTNHHTPRPLSTSLPRPAPHPRPTGPPAPADCRHPGAGGRRRGAAWQGPTGGSRNGNGVEMRCKMSICNGGI